MPPSPFSSISHFCIFSGEKLTLILYQLMHRPNGPSHLRFSRPRPLLGRQSLLPLHPADHGARRRLAMAHGQALQICYRLSTDMVYRYDWIDWILAGSVTAQRRWGWQGLPIIGANLGVQKISSLDVLKFDPEPASFLRFSCFFASIRFART